MRRSAPLLLVSLAAALALRAQAAPRLADERLMCAIDEVQGPPARPDRVLVACGRLHGVQPGGRGEIYRRTESGGIAVAGRAEAVEVEERRAWLRVVPEAGSRPETIAKGGTVELRVLVPADLHRGVLFAVYHQGVVFLDNFKKPIVTLEELLAARDATVEERALAEMVKAGLEVVEFTDSLTQVISHGRWKGKRCKEILLGSTPDDYRAFLRFVRDYPGKYIGQRWKISETYATWIINDMPPSMEDLLAELMGLGDGPGLEARAAQLKLDDLASVFERARREITDWPASRIPEADKRVAVMARIVAARPDATPHLRAEVEHARARTLAKATKDAKAKLEAASAYARAAAEYARVPLAEMREAELERIVCLNNEAGFLDDAGRADEALARIPVIRAIVENAVKGAPDAEIAAHAKLSEAFTIGLGARIANARGDYRKVIAEVGPVLDRYAAVAAPGFRDKEIELIQFLAKAHQKLGEIDAAAKLLERAAKRADELGDLRRQAEIAWSIGDLHYDSSRYQEAVADYERTAEIARRGDDKARLAKALAAAGQALWSLGRDEEAIAKHAEAMRVREASGDEDGIAWQLLQVGKIRVELGDREAARRDLERSLALRQKAGKDTAAEAEVQRELGNLALALKQPDAAERAFVAARAIYKVRALAPDEAWSALGESRARGLRRDFAGAVARAVEAQAIADKTGDRDLRVATRISRARWLQEDGQRAPALAALDEALAAGGDDAGQRTDVLIIRCGQRLDAGDLPGAEADATEALRLSEGAKDAARRLGALGARSGILQARGEYEASVRLFDEMIDLATKSGNRPTLGSTLQKKSWQLANLGRLRDAEAVAGEAQRIAEKNDDPVERAWAMNTLARIAGERGDVREELRLYDAAIPLMRAAGFPYGESALIFNRALVASRLRDFDEALRGFDEATKIAGTGLSAELSIAIASSRGWVLAELDRHDEADAALADATDRARASVPQRVPRLLSLRGRYLAKRGQLDRALPFLREAVALADARAKDTFDEIAELGVALARAGRPEAEAALTDAIARAERAGGALPWEALFQLGRLQAEARRVDEAIKTLERAAREIEKGEVVLESDVAKSRYWADKAGVYTLLVKLHLGLGRAGDALRYVERAKAAELTELARGAGASADDLGRELEIAEARFVEELDREQQKTKPDPDKVRRLDDLLADVRRRRADYIDQLDRRLGDRGGPRDVYAIRPLELEKLQEHVPDGTLVLSPIALDDQLVVFAVTRSAITHFDAPAGAAEIDRLVAAVLAEVAPPGGTQRGAKPLQQTGRKLDDTSVTRLRDPAKRLYDLLVRPALDRFGVPKTLVVSASGGLRYLPLGALHDGAGWLVDKTALIAVTSLDQQKFSTPPVAGAKANVLALADPDGSLPGARREVSEVRGVFGDVRVLDGAGATLAALREQIRAPGYDIVHLATHGRLDGARPDQSHILLAGQPLYYKDIPALRFARTRLVVLSACDTASRGSGAEVTGLAYQFERTSVRAVLATLWPVDDTATARLMADFYKRLRGGAGYVDALAAAQRALAADAKYKHPYYWAPFVVIGAP